LAAVYDFPDLQHRLFYRLFLNKTFDFDLRQTNADVARAGLFYLHSSQASKYIYDTSVYSIYTATGKQTNGVLPFNNKHNVYHVNKTIIIQNNNLYTSYTGSQHWVYNLFTHAWFYHDFYLLFPSRNNIFQSIEVVLSEKKLLSTIGQ